MRHAFPFLLLTTVVALSGCGGGGGNGSFSQRVSTGGTGRVENVQFGPKGGTAFVTRTQTFQMAWTNAAPPPQVVDVSLMRYQEARGGEARSIAPTRVGVQQAAGSLTWDIKAASDMAADGVYFLELATAGQTTQRTCYLVDSTRAAATTRGVTINTGTGSGQLGSVQISPTTGTVYLPRASTFQITWPEGTTPPPSFEVRLWRYKEARSGASRSVEEQALSDPARVGSSYTWTFRRRDSVELDGGGVYYLELRAPGQTDVRAAYIVSLEQ